MRLHLAAIAFILRADPKARILRLDRALRAINSISNSNRWLALPASVFHCPVRQFHYVF